MSIRALDTVFRSKIQDQSDVLILLALADWADDDGACYPSMPAIAKKARLSDRTVQKHVGDLEKAGLVTRMVRVGRGRSNLYRLHLDRIAAWDPGSEADAEAGAEATAEEPKASTCPENPEAGAAKPRS